MRQSSQDLRPPEHYLQMALDAAAARGSRRCQALTMAVQAQRFAQLGQHRKSAEVLAQGLQMLRELDMNWHAKQAASRAAT